MENRKVLLSIKDLEVKFHVRGRVLTAIRGISLDIYENESIAIVGESAAGKSVFTKTFAGMLDSNGFISKGDIIFNDDELIATKVPFGPRQRKQAMIITAKLNAGAPAEHASAVWRELKELESEKDRRSLLSEEDEQRFSERMHELTFAKTELFNYKLTLDTSKEKAKIKEAEAKIDEYAKQIKALEEEKKQLLAKRQSDAKSDTAYLEKYNTRKAELQKRYEEEKASYTLSAETVKRNEIIAKEILLSTERLGGLLAAKRRSQLVKACLKAMQMGVDLNNEKERNAVFETAIFRVVYKREENDTLYGDAVLDLAKIKEPSDWTKIRGSRIATVFQDPMTSLNPIITIGKQISSIIIKHQNCSEIEARARALTLMKKVGIPNAEQRYDDYPFQYSGGMRQRIVIAIALSCQPKILICDEPTTALDVTIQTQILKLIKDLQKEFNYTIVFITHDLGVVANVADRVAVLYAGQIVELGTVEEIFFDPRHPYTWALLSSMPQLAQRNTKLYSITGTPPSLYNSITGDPFAPRNPYCLKIDTLKAPPVFKVSETHYAKTWLLDPRSPKIEKPEAIRDIHEKLMKAFNI